MFVIRVAPNKDICSPDMLGRKKLLKIQKYDISCITENARSKVYRIYSISSIFAVRGYLFDLSRDLSDYILIAFSWVLGAQDTHKLDYIAGLVEIV